MYRSRKSLYCLLLFCLVGCAGATVGSPVGGGATNPEIDATDAALRISILAADSMAGREAGTPGGARAASYLAAELRRLGLRPGGDNGTYLQAVPLIRTHTALSVTLTPPGSTPRSLQPTEIVSVAGLGGLPLASRNEGEGPVMFVGHLVDHPTGTEIDINDLRGSIAIVRLSVPAGIDPAATPPRLVVASLFSAASPASAVLIVAEETEAEFWDYAAEVAAKGILSLAANSPPPGPTGPPFFLVSAEFAERLLGVPLSQAREPRTGLGSLRYTLSERIDSVVAHNVVGIIEGSATNLLGEYVTLGAHFDHVGIGAAVLGDSIYNGADDNASGTAALLEVAEALASGSSEPRPQRSVLFVWHTAEESGLLGSEHFTENPPAPVGSFVAHINLDMVGRNDPDSIFSVGSRRLSSQLATIVEGVNQQQPRPFVFNFEYDAPDHPEMLYCRSDHYNFARFGIPSLFLTSGLHDQYHAPADEYDLIDPAKVARVATLVHDVVRELANRPSRPRVDQPVPPLGTPCS